MTTFGPIDRRRFLIAAAATTASIPFARAQETTTSSSASVATATLSLHTDRPGPTIPANFVGLSYETQQLSDPTFFSPGNAGLVAQFRAISSTGVLRIGGNTSDYGFWKPTPSSAPPPRKERPYKLGDPPPTLSYAIEPVAIHNLRAFLDATGWTCLYGINLGTNIPSLAATEAAYVAKMLGAKLEYFQIGNEADRFGSTIRDPKITGKPWNADAFLDEWLIFANAILSAVPDTHFGMPDIASNAQWFATIAERLANEPIHLHIACMSHHYYIGGPPSNPKITTDFILQPDPRVPKLAEMVSAAATKLQTKWRMTEGNTCYRGGKPGVSDVFAASLWAADYLLLLASLGYSGVNLHGGDGKMVAESLGGTLPGDEIVLAEHGDPANHPHPYYTPIAHIGDSYIAEPVSFGMRFASAFAGATMIPVDFNPGSVNATAYAAKRPNGQMILAILNKDESKPLPLPSGNSNWIPSLTLYGSSLSAREAHLDSSIHTRQSFISPSTAMIFGRLTD
jgi:hypothetical protein